MGRIVRELGEGVTKHYWYPGQKGDWIKSLIAIGAGIAVFVLCFVLFKHSLAAATVGSCVTTGIGGVYLGRRDVDGLRVFRNLSAERRAAMADSGRAAWRGAIQGFTCAAAAVIVFNMSATGFVADWLLPIVPALVGALAHSAGMIYEKMADFAQEADAETTPVARARAKAFEHAR